MCRRAGLSLERLQKKGLFGALVRSALPAFEGAVRHIHPMECAALVGYDPTIKLGDSTMLQLAGMGQIASPFHSAWIFGHIAMHLDLLQFGVKTSEPIDHLKAYRAWHLLKCRSVWPSQAVFMHGHQIADDLQWFGMFAQVPLDFFLGFEWWTAPRSVHVSGCGPAPAARSLLLQASVIPLASFLVLLRRNSPLMRMNIH